MTEDEKERKECLIMFTEISSIGSTLADFAAYFTSPSRIAIFHLQNWN